jgi:hypothetical protein
MPTVTYRPPDILHWFSTGSQEALRSAKRKGKALTSKRQETTVKEKLFQAASMAADFGRGAGADLVHRQAAETVYRLYSDHLTIKSPLAQTTVDYADVLAVRSHARDRFEIEYDGGTLTVRPIAHLVSGRIRVPVGWMRNDIEVPFTMLLEELSARCGVEIEPA